VRVANKPAAFAFPALMKQAGLYLKTGAALAWTLLGFSTGQVIGAYWIKVASRTNGFALGPMTIDPICGAIALAGYLLIARKPRLYDCLRVAHLLFIEECLTVSEYKAMRSKCLRRWGGA
jgi:hypothetical protein